MHFKPPDIQLRHWILSFLIFTSLVGLAGCRSSNLEDTQPTLTPLPTVVQAARVNTAVQRGAVVKEVEFTGYIVATKSEELFFHSDGYIREINVRRGDKVTAGQVLASLEAKDLQSQIAQAQQELKNRQVQSAAAIQANTDDLAQAQVELKIEQLRLEEAKYYVKLEGSVSSKYAAQIQEQVVQLALLKVERFKRGADPQVAQSVESSRLDIARLENLLADTQIVAPFDGNVIGLNINRSGESATAYRTVMTVGDLTQLEVTGTLAGDIPKSGVAAGMPAVILDANQTNPVPIHGKVRFVPTGTPGEVEKAVRVEIDQSLAGSGLALDSTVKVRVQTANRGDTLWLPPLFIRLFEGRTFVILQESSGLRRVDIKTGLAGSERVEILDGLSEGQVVVAP